MTFEREETTSATSKMYVDNFRNHDIQLLSNSALDPYRGKLSPGCIACMKGTWSCSYLIRSCTRNCYFCPRDRTESDEPLPRPYDLPLKFHDVKEYIKYLKARPLEGIGLSGGEPFLVFERLVEYIREIREVFGQRHYIWTYTNGDLVNEDRLAILQQIGLNEIRFDLSANGYNLYPVKLAAEYIDTVSVQIPAIPEDVERVKTLLEQFDAIGIKHLILNQLMVTEYNQKELKVRGYSFLAGPFGTCIPESKLAALEILKHAVDTNLDAGVSYCSIERKGMFQARSYRKRYAPFCQDIGEMVTETGFLRRISFGDSIKDEYLQKCLEKAILAEPYRPLVVTYYAPQIKISPNESEDPSNPLSFGGNLVLVIKSKSFEIKLENRISAILFHSFFIKNNIDQDLVGIMNLFGTDEGQKTENLEFVRHFYLQFEPYEFLNKALVDYNEM